MDKKVNQIVHVLARGLPLCGFSSDSPINWNTGHVWIGINSVDWYGSVTCVDCKEMLERRKREKTNTE